MIAAVWSSLLARTQKNNTRREWRLYHKLWKCVVKRLSKRCWSLKGRKTQRHSSEIWFFFFYHSFEALGVLLSQQTSETVRSFFCFFCLPCDCHRYHLMRFPPASGWTELQVNTDVCAASVSGLCVRTPWHMLTPPHAKLGQIAFYFENVHPTLN